MAPYVRVKSSALCNSKTNLHTHITYILTIDYYAGPPAGSGKKLQITQKFMQKNQSNMWKK